MIKTDINAFCVDAKKLFLRNPYKFRYTVSHNHANSSVKLHCTDNDLHIKTVITQQSDLRKVDRLIQWLVENMAADLTKEEVKQKLIQDIQEEEAKLPLHTLEI